MHTESLSAAPRVANGKGGARKLRRAGQLPGVVYRDGQPAVPVAVDANELETIFRKTGDPNTLIALDIEGQRKVCLVKDVQRHPVNDKLRHVDLYEVDPEQKVTVDVLVRAAGTAIGLKLGGKLRIVRRKLKLRARPADIPAALMLDVTDLEIDDFIKVSQIEPPKGCELIYLNDFNVMTVVGKTAAQVAAELEEAEAEAEAEAEGTVEA